MQEERLLQGLKDCCFEELCERNAFQQVVEYMDTSVYSQFEFNYGATKEVLFPLGMDIVVKIPYEGQIHYWEGEASFKPFHHAGENCGWDYCAVEEELYDKAIIQNLGHHFLETKFIGIINNHPIYIQDKVYKFAESDEDYGSERWNKTESRCYEKFIECFHPGWIADFIDYYSWDEFEALYCFLEEYGICDLHGGNLGYTQDGVPVIVDYGGFE